MTVVLTVDVMACYGLWWEWSSSRVAVGIPEPFQAGDLPRTDLPSCARWSKWDRDRAIPGLIRIVP